jgi:hypothetical protein
MGDKENGKRHEILSMGESGHGKTTWESEYWAKVETPQHYENLPYRTVIQHETT